MQSKKAYISKTIIITKNKIMSKQEKQPKEVKKQKISATYTIRAFGENIKKLKELKLISEETMGKMRETQKEIVKNYVNQLTD